MKAALAVLLLPLASAHSFIAEPADARRSAFGQTWSAKDGNVCGDGKSSGNPGRVTYKRGQVIPFKWPRNNHPGGFVRLAIAPFQNSDSQEAFDSKVFHINCHESGCRSNSGDLLGGDGDKYPEHTNLCNSSFVMPAVPDGRYTIQV